jgi:hypothetical protein
MNTEGRVHRGPPFFLRLFFYMIAPQNRIAFCAKGVGCPCCTAGKGGRHGDRKRSRVRRRGAPDQALCQPRLYNTETSDYVTLDDIAGFIRDGREVKIVDLKSGDDLTRQYLLQIIAEHESRGENVLPIAC